MLANLNEVWKLADEKKIAIGAFNIVNFVNILAVIWIRSDLLWY